MRSYEPGHPVLFTNPTTGKELTATYIGAYGRWAIIEAPTESGHLGLRYVDPAHLRPAPEASGG